MHTAIITMTNHKSPTAIQHWVEVLVFHSRYYLEAAIEQLRETTQYQTFDVVFADKTEIYLVGGSDD